MKKPEVFVGVIAGFLGGLLSVAVLKAKPAIAGEPTHYERIISAGKMVLVDKSGIARFGCSVSDDGRVTLAVSDQKGHVRIGFGVLADGSPSLDFYDGSNQARMVVGLKEDAPYLVFNDSKEIHRILMRQTPDGWPHIDINDAQGRRRAVLGSTPLGEHSSEESSLVLFDSKGQLIWKAPS